jgi:hypothetical protein
MLHRSVHARITRNLTILLLAGLALTGCSQSGSRVRDSASSKTSFEEILRPQADEWLGKTRDARIKVKGFPDHCANVEGNEEVCEWLTPGQHHLIYTYDSHGLAKAWSYRGPFGTFGSLHHDSTERSREVQERPASSQKALLERVSRSM